MKKLLIAMVLVGSMTGANALTPGEYQERLARKSMFDTMISAVNVIVAAPAQYIKSLMAIDDLPQATKDQYAKTTTGYVATFNKILGLGKSKIDSARADVEQEIANYKP
jgi:hypothetical protein